MRCSNDRRPAFWRGSFVWKLMLVNSLVIGTVIWLVGVSLKDYACALVGSYDLLGQEQQQLFRETMHMYLLRACAIALLAAGLIYYVWMRRVLASLQSLTQSTHMMAEGRYPKPVRVQSEDEFGQLGRDFNRMVASLKENEKARTQLFSDISHDLRTPLSNLNGYLEALSSGVIEGDPELYRSLQEESRHLIQLADQLRQLAVLEGMGRRRSAASAAGVSERADDVQMEKLLPAVVQSFELGLQQAGVSCELEAEAGMVQGDEAGLRKIMTNLIGNALQYSTTKWIRVAGVKGETRYRVMVQNEGEPIAAGQAARIFDRFYRIEASRSRETGGSGLGLAIVKEIVKQHGGDCGLDSNDGRHCFWFELPLKQESDGDGAKWSIQRCGLR